MAWIYGAYFLLCQIYLATIVTFPGIVVCGYDCSFFIPPVVGSKVKTVIWLTVPGGAFKVDCVRITNLPLGSMVIPSVPFPAASDVPIWLKAPLVGLMEKTCTTPVSSTARRNLPVASTVRSDGENKNCTVPGDGVPGVSIENSAMPLLKSR